MLARGRELTEHEKAEYFDRVVEAFLYWNNCPLDKLKEDNGGSVIFRYRSRQDAAGYQVLCMLMDEKVLRSANETEAMMLGGQQ